VGVTVIVAVIVVVPVFVAVNEAMSPVPLEARPIAVFELVHENDPPAGVLTKPEAETDALLQTVISAGTVTVGVGLTVIVYDEGAPTQLLAVGVTEIVDVMVVVPVFVAVNEAMSPVPLEARPMAVLELVHENDPPAGVLTKLVAGTEALLQTVMFAGTATVGVGLTVIVYEEGVPTQLLAVGVTVIVAVIVVVPVFVAVNEAMSPVPLEASPIEVLEFVQENVPPAGVLTKFVAAMVALLQTVISVGTATVGVG